MPLAKVLDKLGEEGILTLLTETGTRLNTALLAGGHGGPNSSLRLARKSWAPTPSRPFAA